MGKKKSEKSKGSIKDINGHKFKCMWSTKIMFFFFFIEYCAVVMALTACMIDKKESINYSEESLVMFNVVLLVFLLILVFINIKLLGRIAAVINERGIHTKEGYIAWKDIKAVRYHTRFPSKHIATNNFYCSLSVFTTNKEFEITHAPRIMMWYIKIKKTDVKIKCDYGLIILLICPFIFGAMIGLLNR